MITTYFLNSIMGNVFNTKTSPALPTSYYLALSTTMPSRNGTGVSEPSATGTAYSRVELSSLSTPTDGVIKNTEVVSFPESTAPWGNIGFYAIFDSETDGNLLVYGAADQVKSIGKNDMYLIKANGLTLTLSDNVTDAPVA